MKVLISTMPASGHVNIFQPVARALFQRGHSVHWLTGSVMRRSVEATGATFIPFNLASASILEQRPIPDPGTSGLSAAISILRRMFIDPVPVLVAQYQAILQDLDADILLVDLCSVPAHTLRDLEAREIPPWGSSAFPAAGFWGQCWNSIKHRVAWRFVLSKVNDCLNAERGKLGLGPLVGELHIMPTTLAFEFPRRRLKDEVRFVGPLVPLLDAGWEKPHWWGEMLQSKARKKVVHVTQGTFATHEGNLIIPTIRALKEQEDVLLTVTTLDPEVLKSELEVPENVRVEKFIPHQELLRHVAVMVTNGGYGGVLTALSFGVPLVCAGLTEDKALVNARVAWTGAGLDLRTNTPSEEEIRRAVKMVLGDKKFAEAAARIRDDFRKHNSPEEACDALENMVKKRAVAPS